MKLPLTHSLMLTAICAVLSLNSSHARADDGPPPGAGAPQGEAVVVSSLRSIPIAQILPGGRVGQIGPHMHPFGGAPVGRHAPGRPHAGHVIDLLMRNCLLECAVEAGARHLQPFCGPFGGPVCGDLQLVSVNLLAEATPACGPMIAVTFHNNSQNCVRQFSITAVAVLTAIDIASPTTVVRVPEIAAGGTATIEMQLPATAMAMTPDGQNLAPFDTLVVALDSFDELLEADELNNIAILRRAEMVMVTPAAAEVAEPPAAVEAAPVQAAPPSAAVGPAPSDNAVPPPNNNIDFDQLDLGEAAESAELFIRR